MKFNKSNEIYEYYGSYPPDFDKWLDHEFAILKKECPIKDKTQKIDHWNGNGRFIFDCDYPSNLAIWVLQLQARGWIKQTSKDPKFTIFCHKDKNKYSFLILQQKKSILNVKLGYPWEYANCHKQRVAQQPPIHATQ